MTAREIVSNLKALRPVSQAAVMLMRMLDQPELNNEAIVESLKRDIVLTARVLKTCNSSFFGFRDGIESVDQAVLLLGHKQLTSIVLSLSVGDTLDVRLEAYGFEAKDLWRHSVSTAAVAEILAQDELIPNLDPSAAFTAGLLHDIGKLAFTQILAPDLLSRVRHEISEHGFSRIEAEREVIGTDHAEVGAFLLSEWRIPGKIVEAVANHHRPVLKPELCLSAVTCIANSIAHLAGSSPGWEAYAIRVDPVLIESLKLTPERVEMLTIAARESFGSIEQILNLP
jgi:putative nucleotidyltransferase with HDIG domain